MIRGQGFVYIAGCYRGGQPLHDYRVYAEIDRNIARARDWAIRLAENDIPFFCPHLNSAHFEVIAPHIEPDYWLAMDLELVDAAVAMFMVPGWEESKGANMELKVALSQGKPHFDEDSFEDLVDFWKRRCDALHQVTETS